MATPTHLHIYECAGCRTIAASTVKITRPPLRCTMCARYMGFRWTQPIETQAERDIASQGLMFNPFVERAPQACDLCKEPITAVAEFKVSHVGTFCSAACAQAGRVKHQAYMQRLVDEQAAQDRKERPWLT